MCTVLSGRKMGEKPLEHWVESQEQSPLTCNAQCGIPTQFALVRGRFSSPGAFGSLQFGSSMLLSSSFMHGSNNKHDQITKKQPYIKINATCFVIKFDINYCYLTFLCAKGVVGKKFSGTGLNLF